MEGLSDLAFLLERGEAHGEGHVAHGGLEPPEDFQVGGDEARLEKQVLRRVARDGEFGRQDEVRA